MCTGFVFVTLCSRLRVGFGDPCFVIFCALEKVFGMCKLSQCFGRATLTGFCGLMGTGVVDVHSFT